MTEMTHFDQVEQLEAAKRGLLDENARLTEHLAAAQRPIIEQQVEVLNELRLLVSHDVKNTSVGSPSHRAYQNVLNYIESMIEELEG